MIFLRPLLLLVLTLAGWPIYGQVCSGSLGDPVVNVNFGNGPNPGGRLPGSITNYNYVSIDCPQDGYYALRNSTTACHGNTWHDVFTDHTTGDVNGYMMIVNASFTPGDFYLDTVKGLCPNTTYEFASWILNLSRPSSCGGTPIRPNLTFRIETTTGTVLSTYNTDAIDYGFGPAWKQYGVFFTTPASVSNVVLRLTNNAPGGCGIDIALDDITFRPCGPTIKADFVNSQQPVIDVCLGKQSNAYDMTALVSTGYTNPVYQWQSSVDSSAFIDIAGARSLTYRASPQKPGLYRYRLAVSQAGSGGTPACRIVSNLLAVHIYPNPRITVSVNNPVCAGSPLQLSAAGADTYAWTGPGGFSASVANPASVATLNSSGNYLVTATSGPGCTSIDSLIVRVFPQATVSAGSDLTTCEGVAVALSGSDAASYRWSPAKGLSTATIRNPLANPADTTMYTLTITDANGCMRSDSVTVNVLKKPVADAGKEKQLFEGQSVTLDGSAAGTRTHYYWQPVTAMTGGTTLKPVVAPADNTTYTLFVVSDVGCGTAQDNVFVRVFRKVVIPNAFSPNADGINDDWNIENLATYTQALLTVFNRYGQEVYRSTGYSRRWNGTINGNPLPAGTYYYTLDLKNGMALLSGWVLIVR